ncbi:MAG: exo-alpha-sialidase, partial [Candidatus Omnitrophica bacterium]|nr:exo-alpha-sialidase [Candidatus Omnitrophota bacterium]
WSEGKSFGVVAPESPATLRRIPSTGNLLLIWNDNYTEGAGHSGKRNPLTAAISRDEGKTWTHKRNMENDPNETYSYTSLDFANGRALLSYYVADEESGWISSRFRSVPIGWFYEGE